MASRVRPTVVAALDTVGVQRTHCGAPILVLPSAYSSRAASRMGSSLVLEAPWSRAANAPRCPRSHVRDQRRKSVEWRWPALSVHECEWFDVIRSRPWSVG